MKRSLFLFSIGVLILLLTGITSCMAANTEMLQCGDTTYNPEHQSCCNGKVYEGHPILQMRGLMLQHGHTNLLLKESHRWSVFP